MAEEPRIYKHVDEKGKVTYSQTPPSNGAAAKKMDATPAYRGQGGYNIGSPYDDPRVYSQDYWQYRQNEALRQRQQQMEDARKKRLADLEAQCNRNRGTDCSNPDVLRYIESTNTPRVYRR